MRRVNTLELHFATRGRKPWLPHRPDHEFILRERQRTPDEALLVQRSTRAR